MSVYTIVHETENSLQCCASSTMPSSGPLPWRWLHETIAHVGQQFALLGWPEVEHCCGTKVAQPRWVACRRRCQLGAAHDWEEKGGIVGWRQPQNTRDAPVKRQCHLRTGTRFREVDHRVCGDDERKRLGLGGPHPHHLGPILTTSS
jgi:hypothetical protein